MVRTAEELITIIKDTAEELCGADTTGLHPRALLALMQSGAQASSMVDAARTSLVDRIDLAGASTFDGIKSTTAWLCQNARASSATASRDRKRARVLRQLPLIRERYESGRLSTDQVDAFVRVFNPRTESAMERDEALLADLAEGLTADDTARQLRSWAEHADDDGPEPDPGHKNRGLSMTQSFDRSWTGSFTLGSADGALLDAAINRLAHRYFLDDQRTGAERSATQRRVDALVALALGDATPNTTINLVINADDLEAGILSSRTTAGTEAAAGMTGDGSVGASAAISAADTVRLSRDASVRPIVVDPSGGAVLFFGRTQRLASPLQRAALAIESKDACSFVGCTNPIDVAHHIQGWSSGSAGTAGSAGMTAGPTDLPNLIGLCHEHHDLIHDEHWQVHKASDGTVSWRRPDGSVVDPRPGWKQDRPKWRGRRCEQDGRASRSLPSRRLLELDGLVGRPRLT